MDRYRDIIKAPIVTEKSLELSREHNTFVFSVDPRASKIEIKEAIEKLFNVHVESLRTITIKTKKKRVGRYTGLTNRGKKAIVTLAEGETIDLG